MNKCSGWAIRLVDVSSEKYASLLCLSALTEPRQFVSKVSLFAKRVKILV